MTKVLSEAAPQSAAAAPLAAGFLQPVHDAQRCFRAVMNALARPGKSLQIDTAGLVPPQPLTPVAAAIALTLLDYDTPVWLDGPLARSEAAKTFLRFHTGAPIVSAPVEAAFALISDPERLANLGNFNQGSPDYPDRSATLILMNQTIFEKGTATLSGPGIETTASFLSGPVSVAFWAQVKANHAQFPRGIDLIFAGSDRIAALPRSTTVTLKEV